jgi:hypothetical protein
MDENPAIEPPPKETNFLVWSAARRIGVARKSADGGIVVKLDMAFATILSRVTEPGRVLVFQCADCEKLDFRPAD